MMRPFRLHPAAEAEALEAAAYIKEEDPFQASLFKEALKNAMIRARRKPENYRQFDGEFRKIRVGKFSYPVDAGFLPPREPRLGHVLHGAEAQVVEPLPEGEDF